MKQIFKRTLATATGSLLVLSQIAATAVNISAADTTAGDKLTVDRGFIVDVDLVDSEIQSYVDETFDLTTIEDSEKPVAAATHENAPHSLWASELETYITQQLGEGGSREVATAGAKTYVKKALLKVGYVEEAQAQAIVDALADTAKVEFGEDLSATVTMSCDDIGETAGDILINVAEAKGVEMVTDKGEPIVIDWKDLHISGKIVVTGKLDPATKTVTYSAVVTDEANTAHTSLETLLGDNGYVMGKFTDMCEIIKTKAAEVKEESIERKKQELVEQLVAQGLSEEDANAKVEEESAKQDFDSIGNFDAEFKEAEAELRGKLDEATAAANAVTNTKVEGLTVSADGIDGAQQIYDAYKQALTASAKAENATLLTSKLDKLPTDVADALKSERFSNLVDKAVNAANGVLGEKASVNFTAADINELAQLAYDYEFSAPNGVSFDVKFSMPDDEAQRAKLKESVGNAIQAEVDAYNEANGTNKQLKEVVAHKDVSLKTDNNVNTFSGTTTYDVKLVIDELIFEDQTDETTTNVSAEIVVDGLDEAGKIYWSEETAAIDLSAVTATLNIYVDGQINQTRAVSQYFGADEAAIGDIAFDGFKADGYKVSYKLKDAAGLTQVITAAGFDAALASTFTEGQSFGEQTVYLVLRGDVDLDNDIDISDAQSTLIYYNDTQVIGTTGYASITENGAFLGSGAYADDPETYGKYGYYASNVSNGGDKGKVNLEDATGILAYYNIEQVLQETPTWLEAVGTEVTPADADHTDPFAGDTYYGGPAA